jgi:hypothetical protein
MCVNIEDAGFEIRDMIAWVYGSGFPKSQNVGKAIDKAAPRRGQFDAFAEHFAERLKTSGKKQKELAALFPSKTGGLTGCVWNWANGANVPTKKQFGTLKPLLGLSDEFDTLIDRVEAEREVIGKSAHKPGIANGTKGHHTVGGTIAQHVDITAPATPEAQQWDGWGTALKPALEPITVARKPIKSTVANNVLEHGTGAINIGGCRVEGEQWASSGERDGIAGEILGGTLNNSGRSESHPAGRWPANLIHDGSDEVTELFPQTASSKASMRGVGLTGADEKVYGKGDPAFNTMRGHSDNGGSAARFFYTAKASKDDRDKGNTHPTVKPTDLMAYLCRLVTPPGGIVLDPFMGSGTTGKAALAEGFGFIGIERDPEYYAIAESRFNGAQIGLPLVS